MLKDWLNPLGLLEHFVIGGLGLWVFQKAHFTPGQVVLATLAYAVAHELGDGDLTKDSHAPLNGLLDTLAFLVIPIYYYVRLKNG